MHSFCTLLSDLGDRRAQHRHHELTVVTRPTAVGKAFVLFGPNM